jgi:hypothetical protein
LGQGLAAALVRAREDGAQSSDRWGSRALILFGYLLAIGSFVLVAVAPETDTPRMFLYAMAVIAAVAFIMGSTVLYVQLERGFFECWWGGALCLLLMYAVTFESARDLAESPAGFCAQVADAVPAEAPLYDADLVMRDPVALYYLERKVTPVAVLEPGEAYPVFLTRLVSATNEKLRSEPGCYVLTYSGKDKHGRLYGVRPLLPQTLYREVIHESGFAGHERLTAHLLRARQR